MSKKNDEKTKILASFLSTLGSTCANVGILAPTVAYWFNIGDFQNRVRIFDLFLFYAMVIFVMVSLVLLARKTLDKLSD